MMIPSSFPEKKNQISKPCFLAVPIVIISLTFSLLLYLAYRSPETVINLIIRKATGPEGFYDFQSFLSLPIEIPKWVSYSLPGGLWVFALTLILRNPGGKPGFHRFFIQHIPLFVAGWIEMLQGLHWIRGWFDPVDVLLVGLGYLLARNSLLPDFPFPKKGPARVLYPALLGASVLLAHEGKWTYPGDSELRNNRENQNFETTRMPKIRFLPYLQTLIKR